MYTSVQRRACNLFASDRSYSFKLSGPVGGLSLCCAPLNKIRVVHPRDVLTERLIVFLAPKLAPRGLAHVVSDENSGSIGEAYTCRTP